MMSLVSKAETLSEASFGLWRQMLVAHQEPVAMPRPADASWEEEVRYYYEAPIKTVKKRVLQLELYLTSCARDYLWCTAQEPARLQGDTFQTTSQKIYALRSLLWQRTEQTVRPYQATYIHPAPFALGDSRLEQLRALQDEADSLAAELKNSLHKGAVGERKRLFRHFRVKDLRRKFLVTAADGLMDLTGELHGIDMRKTTLLQQLPAVMREPPQSARNSAEFVKEQHIMCVVEDAKWAAQYRIDDQGCAVALLATELEAPPS